MLTPQRFYLHPILGPFMRAVSAAEAAAALQLATTADLGALQYFTISETAPENLVLPWFNPADESLSIYDTTTSAWVAVSGASTAIVTSTTPPEDTEVGWFDPEDGSLSFWYEDAWIATGGADGADANPTTVTISTAATGSTLTGLATVDETIYLKSVTSPTVGSIVWRLPATADSRVGQIKTFVSDKSVTSTSVSVFGGGTIEGTALSTMVAFEPYSFQYVVAGTWLRLA